jgi:ABC-type dipeptide/oligopeptide/nickel transport system ATPase component
VDDRPETVGREERAQRADPAVGEALRGPVSSLPPWSSTTYRSAERASTTSARSTSEIPKKKLVVLTGVSGSGKSSLAFDTLYAEGQRRYVESLSAYARQFLGQMEKPRYDTIRGLSPTISIEQKTTGTNPRSTVGTITEISDYLRVSTRASASSTATSAASPCAARPPSRSRASSRRCPRAPGSC